MMDFEEASTSLNQFADTLEAVSNLCEAMILASKAANLDADTSSMANESLVEVEAKLNSIVRDATTVGILITRGIKHENLQFLTTSADVRISYFRASTRHSKALTRANDLKMKRAKEIADGEAERIAASQPSPFDIAIDECLKKFGYR